MNRLTLSIVITSLVLLGSLANAADERLEGSVIAYDRWAPFAFLTVAPRHQVVVLRLNAKSRAMVRVDVRGSFNDWVPASFFDGSQRVWRIQVQREKPKSCALLNSNDADSNVEHNLPSGLPEGLVELPTPPTMNWADGVEPVPLSEVDSLPCYSARAADIRLLSEPQK